MGRITILAPEIIHQIAAGEVVERPASVVKELLENAIDAGATQITVEIREAGLKEIRVIDNGSGMTREDAILALERHATSKISSIKDLNQLETLGFRGEALPAIAAVSRFTLITRTPEEISGTKLTVTGGKVDAVSPIGCPPGTQVIVKDLFYNTPARRKFLKSLRTEAGIISDLISRFALGYPEISFRYFSGKRLSLSTNGQGKLLDVLGILYGNEAMRYFVEVSVEEEGIKLYGFVSQPEYYRANRSYQSFFVNRRLVHNTFLNHALENAYWSFIPKGHFPVAVLFITVDPSTIDVNVHPTKREVRFSNPTLVADVIQQGVRRALSGQRFYAGIQIPGITSINEENEEASPSAPAFPVFYEERIPFSYRREGLPFNEQQVSPVTFQSLDIIGQALGLYIIAEREGEIYFIDQHAAHERIRYESIKKQLRAKKHFQQKLISPIEIKLTPPQREAYEEHKHFIASLGYTFKESRDDLLSILTVPADMRETPERNLVEILDLLQENTEMVKDEPEILYEKVAALIACKSAIKSGERLSMEEMQNLLKQLDQTDQPGNCPHGRPTYFKITSAELAKRFHRI